jgi:transposase
MPIDITMSFIREKKFGNRVYRYLVESYRDKNGKIKQRTIKYLGRVIKTKEGEKLVKARSLIDQLDVMRVSSFGPPAVLCDLADGLGVIETIDDTVPSTTGLSPGSLLLLMAINHLVGRKSVSKIPIWYRRTCLPRLFDIPPEEITKDRLLDAMDALCYRDESGALLNYAPVLYRKFWESHTEDHPEDSTLFYDLTEVVVHGITCVLAKPGYNSKNIRKRQVKVAMVVAKGSKFPVLMKELRGNVADPATLDEIVTELKEMGVKKCTLVLDRSFSNGKTLKTLENEGFDAILGLSKRLKEVRDVLISTSGKELERFDNLVERSKEHAYVKGVRRKFYRRVRNFVVCLSPSKRDAERSERLSAVKETIKRLEKLKRKVEVGNYRNFDRLRKKVNEEAEEVRKYIRVWVKEIDGKPEIGWRLNEALLDEEFELDGKFAILHPSGMTAMEAFENYFQKDEIEKVFRSMRGTLELEPLRHRLRPRVASYLFTGYLAYMLLSIIAYRLRRSGVRQSPDEILEMLEEIEEVTFRRGGKEFSKITKLTKEQVDMIKVLGVMEMFRAL